MILHYTTIRSNINEFPTNCALTQSSTLAINYTIKQKAMTKERLTLEQIHCTLICYKHTNSGNLLCGPSHNLRFHQCIQEISTSFPRQKHLMAHSSCRKLNSQCFEVTHITHITKHFSSCLETHAMVIEKWPIMT